MTQFDDEFAGEPDATAPAAPGSPLSSLRERRKARKAKLQLDLKVPGYEPAVYVRFKPVDQARLASELKKAEKSKDRDAITLANAALLIDACIGVFQVDGDGTEVSIDPDNLTPDVDEWLKFGPELGALLADEGEAFNRAADVARALWDNDVALTAAAGRLYEWSQTMNEDLDREQQGN
ncbi:hypothetical protein GCM10028801_41260 [Nocardioides maradonensis]